MPTYEYECTVCGHTFEQFQSITAESLKHCQVCKKKVRRLVGGGSALLFKGSGFYITDYRSKSYQKEKSAQEKKDNNKPEPPKADKSGSKNEVKPADKNNPKPPK